MSLLFSLLVETQIKSQTMVSLHQACKVNDFENIILHLNDPESKPFERLLDDKTALELFSDQIILIFSPEKVAIRNKIIEMFIDRHEDYKFNANEMTCALCLSSSADDNALYEKIVNSPKVDSTMIIGEAPMLRSLIYYHIITLKEDKVKILLKSKNFDVNRCCYISSRNNLPEERLPIEICYEQIDFKKSHAFEIAYRITDMIMSHPTFRMPPHLLTPEKLEKNSCWKENVEKWKIKQLRPAQLFILVVGVSDDFILIKKSIKQKTNKKPNSENAKIARFFAIARKLPLELQMKLCKTAYNQSGDIIGGKDINAAMTILDF